MFDSSTDGSVSGSVDCSADGLDVLGRIDTLLDEALDGGFELADTADVIAAVGGLESIRAKTAALCVELAIELDESQCFRRDGHGSAKVMTRHVGHLSNAEAAGRARGAALHPALGQVTDALAAGVLGVAQFDLLGRVHANPRVRAAMVEAQGWFLTTAAELSYAEFELAVRQWERLADSEGPRPATNTRSHDRRHVSLLQDHFELGWRLDGSFAALQGAAIDDIFSHYVSAERLADWEKARADHGEAATAAQLARSEPQRRADALWQIFQDAAAADTSAVVPGFVHSIIWSADTYQEMLDRLDGQPAQRLDPATYRCHTLDGVPLDPTETAAASLFDHIRRAVTDAAGVVIDLGRTRTFTGAARTAVQLTTNHCRWPGCTVPTSHCQIDHTTDYAHGGPTTPTNGTPLCARHNRHKQRGYTVSRDPTGTWHTHRPNGTEI